MTLEEWKSKNRDGRNYAHFDKKVSLDMVWNYISDPRKVASHGFYPFIHYTKKMKVYNKETGPDYDKRELCYSPHIDRYIYQL